MFPEFNQKLAQARILVVDDQAINREVLSSIAGQHFRVITSESAEQALDIIAAEPVDLILLDVMLGGMSGLELSARLKQDPDAAEIPIIFMTSLSSQADEQQCWEAGAVDFILKPVNAQTLINRLRVHLTLKFQSELMRKLALQDSLTGVFNRFYLDAQLESGLRNCLRAGLPYSLLMIDIDSFKAFNDAKGHQAGDTCLRWVAQTISRVACRPLDVTGRYGGEEFTVLLPETSVEGAEIVAQKILWAVSNLNIAHPSSDHSVVTVSIGVAGICRREAVSASELMQVADEALYQAKAAGRNTLKLAAGS